MRTTSHQDEYGSFPPDWSVGVLYAGSESCEPGHDWEGIRDHVVLHLVTSGLGRFSNGRRSRELSRGDVFIIRPGTYTHYQASIEQPWTYQWVGFSGLHALELSETVGFSERRPVMQLPDVEPVMTLLDECRDALRRRESASQLRAVGKLYQLFAEIRSQSALVTSRRIEASELVDEARAFMDQNYHREISVLSVARHIGIDRSHFSRVFREQTNESMQDYLIRVRMQKALHLLLQTHLPIKAVAGSVGYSNYHSFARRFGHYYDCSPTEARQEAPTSSVSGRSEMRERRESESRP